MNSLLVGIATLDGVGSCLPAPTTLEAVAICWLLLFIYLASCGSATCSSGMCGLLQDTCHCSRLDRSSVCTMLCMFQII